MNELSKTMRKLNLARQYPDMVKDLTPSELADVVVVVLDQVKVIEKAIKEGRLDGYTPKADKDYLSKDSAIAMLTKEVNKIVKAVDSKVEETKENVDKATQDALKRLQERLDTLEDGKDGVVTEAEIERAAQIAMGMIELPDFESMVAETVNASPEEIRNALELLVGEERYTVFIEDVEGLEDRLQQLSRNVQGSPGGTSKPAVYRFIQDAIADGIIQSSIDSIEDIGDVVYDTLTNGDVLAYNSTSGKWENTALAGGGDMLKATYDPTNVAGDVFDVDNHVDGTTNKVYTATEKTKLAGIEASADVTDATNVDAAGATMNADTDVSGNDWVLDEDNMASDSATKVPTQQSVKAYVDNNAGSVDDTAYNATTWNGVTGTAPSKNAVRDKIEALDSAKQDVLAEGAFVDGDKTKLDGIETSADVTDTANVTAAGALMDSEVTNLAQVKAFDSSDYATSAQGALADTATQPNDLVSTLNVSATDRLLGRVTAGAGVAEELTATQVRTLINVEDGADVTDTANVTSAGALMDSEVTNLADVKAFDPADYATAAQGTTADSAMQDLVDDTTPQLGGNLDANGNTITNLDSSATAKGIVELATTAETNTGTDATRAVTPDGLADSKFGTSSLVSSINFIIDGGGSAITTGVKGYIEIPFACTINQVTLLADQSGSIVVDIWKDTYANYPPTDADSITASAVPTISTATKSQDSTLTGWTTSISAGDILGFNVDSITTCERVTVSLKVTRT